MKAGYSSAVEISVERRIMHRCVLGLTAEVA